MPTLHHTTSPAERFMQGMALTKILAAFADRRMCRSWFFFLILFFPRSTCTTNVIHGLVVGHLVPWPDWPKGRVPHACLLIRSLLTCIGNVLSGTRKASGLSPLPCLFVIPLTFVKEKHRIAVSFSACADTCFTWVFLSHSQAFNIFSLPTSPFPTCLGCVITPGSLLLSYLRRVYSRIDLDPDLDERKPILHS